LEDADYLIKDLEQALR